MSEIVFIIFMSVHLLKRIEYTFATTGCSALPVMPAWLLWHLVNQSRPLLPLVAVI